MMKGFVVVVVDVVVAFVKLLLLLVQKGFAI
jgi:hypothetical protein